MITTTDWFRQVQTLQIPAVLPISSLPNMEATLPEWMNTIREDPLLTIHLFGYANKMLASHDISVRTLEHAVSLLGNTRLVTLSEKIPRADGSTTASKGLLKAIGDSLLAAGLMRQWFEIRQIPWTESDYWMTVFYDLGLWVMWLLVPEKMEMIERQVQQGESREALLTELVGMAPRQWNEKLCNYFQLPIFIEDDSQTSSPQMRIKPFKKNALKFFLPFSHELAFAVRQNWHSQTLDALCRKGEVALGLEDFKSMLKQWVCESAREFRLPEVATAARRLIAQPTDLSDSTESGFSAKDLELAHSLAQPAPVVDLSHEKELAQPQPPIPVIDTPTQVFPQQIENRSILKEIGHRFRVQKAWGSPFEVQESALYGLKKGLSLKRIVVLGINDGFWQPIYNEGCQSNPLLRKLKLPVDSSKLLIELGKRGTALWVNKANQKKAEKFLPPPLSVAADEQGYFLRSFTIKSNVTMLLYTDAFERTDILNETDYKDFKAYCADWNSALERIKQ